MEMLKIFNDVRKEIGVASRDEVHRLGYWHETFHCWIVSPGAEYIYLQLRSKTKKDYPNLLDITAAGHLLADETAEDGVREIKEELGIDVPFEKLIPLGIIGYSMIQGDLIDKEFANVFLYEAEIDWDDFVLQEEEVAGIVRVKFEDFCDFWMGEAEWIRIEGFKTVSGNRFAVDRVVSKDCFVPHDQNYFEKIIASIQLLYN
ncbi:NUDIX hydrolase [Neobacillus terrae]|uniref:NUDIX hydrolase n=1 Tax=Neobacillus terrae TaxID=3034837 RepID=UPI00140BEB9D|nr:NUDIX domain-containing protein [Neobacillus terrae]NHM30041.1 NUDIX domain-containing protein [Neobacillus terrae]